MSKLFFLARKTSEHRSPGQVLVLVAMAMLGLLVTAGLATDVGVLMMRKAQFDRAVDAAALAGAPVATADNSGIKIANHRGQQILAANGITVTSVEPSTGSSATYVCPLTGDEDYCGKTGPGNLPGSVYYHVEARWTVDLFFMQLLKFYKFTLSSSAEAVYYNTVDVFTSPNDQGLLQSSNLELFGPASCASMGDPYSPSKLVGNSSAVNPDYGILPNGEYIFRIAVPPTYTYNLVRVELYDPQTANFAHPASGTTSAALPDPATSSSTYLPGTVYKVDGTAIQVVPPTGTNRQCGGAYDRRSPCLQGGAEDTPKVIDPNNPFWYVRMDENRTAWNSNSSISCTNPGSNSSGYTGTINTQTRFQLYYYKQAATGQLDKVYLAQYTGKRDSGTSAEIAEAFSTALKWVSPVKLSGAGATPSAEQMPPFVAGGPISPGGAPVVLGSPAEPRVGVDSCPSPCSDASNGDFIINLSDLPVNGQEGGEVDGIYEDPNSHVRHIYLSVKSMNGSAENNYSVWAGPAASEEPLSVVPSFVNSRQLYIWRGKQLTTPVKYHEGKGVVTYGVGHLPLNSDSPSRTKFPLAYIGPELAGAHIEVRVWDADAGTNPPIMFYFDTIPTTDYAACWANNLNQCTDPVASGGLGAGTGGGTQFTDMVSACNPICFGQDWGGSTKWAIFGFDLPTDADKDKPRIPFYGGRLMVDYQGGGQDTFGWYITVTARPSLSQ